MKIFKIILCCLVVLMAVASAGCGETTCSHIYVETKIPATCTAEGYNVFTCNQCGDSYRGGEVIPMTNHTGVGTCTQCGTNFASLWNDFVNKACNGYLEEYTQIEGSRCVITGGVTGGYDCILGASWTIGPGGSDSMEVALMLGYNAYDRQWTWHHVVDPGYSSITLTSGGKFEKWSSRSNYIPYSYDDTDGTFVSSFKLLYKALLDTANELLESNGYGFTLANLGLEQ